MMWIKIFLAQNLQRNYRKVEKWTKTVTIKGCSVDVCYDVNLTFQGTVNSRYLTPFQDKIHESLYILQRNLASKQTDG